MGHSSPWNLRLPLHPGHETRSYCWGSTKSAKRLFKLPSPLALRALLTVDTLGAITCWADDHFVFTFVELVSENFEALAFACALRTVVSLVRSFSSTKRTGDQIVLACIEMLGDRRGHFSKRVACRAVIAPELAAPITEGTLSVPQGLRVFLTDASGLLEYLRNVLRRGPLKGGLQCHDVGRDFLVCLVVWISLRYRSQLMQV